MVAGVFGMVFSAIVLISRWFLWCSQWLLSVCCCVPGGFREGLKGFQGGC